jgi:hypothetical protein
MAKRDIVPDILALQKQRFQAAANPSRRLVRGAEVDLQREALNQSSQQLGQ